MNIFSTIGATPGVAEATGSTIGKQSESPEAGLFASELETAETALVPGVETGRSEQEVDPNGLIAQLVALDLLATTTPQSATEVSETAHSESPTLGVVAVSTGSGPILSPEQRAKLDLRVSDLRLLVDRSPESAGQPVVNTEEIQGKRPSFDTSVQGIVRDTLLRAAAELGIRVDSKAQTGEIAGQLLEGAKVAGLQPEALVKSIKNAFSVEAAELSEPAQAALAGLLSQMGISVKSIQNVDAAAQGVSPVGGLTPISKGPGNVGYKGTGQGRPNDPVGRIHPGAQGGFIGKGGRGFQLGNRTGTDPVTISGDLRDWIRPIPVAVTAADVAQASKNIEQFAVSLAGKPLVGGNTPEAPVVNATASAPAAGVTALSTDSSAHSGTSDSGQGSTQSPVAPASDAKGEKFSLNLAETRVSDNASKSSVASPNQDSSLDALNTYAVVEPDDLDESVLDTSTGDASAAELGVDDISSPTINRTESKEIREGIDRGIRESTEALMKMAEERRPGQITVRMMPEDLGIIEVTLSQFGTRFDIDVQATDDRVRSSMNAHRNDLVQNLETRGVNVGSFNVSDQTKGDMTQQQQRQQQEGLLREDLQRAANLNSWETPATISTPAPSYAVANRQAVDVTA